MKYKRIGCSELYLCHYSPLFCCRKISVQSVSLNPHPPFLGALAKFRKATETFVMSVCPSVRPLGTVMHGQREIDLIYAQHVSGNFYCLSSGAYDCGYSNVVYCLNVGGCSIEQHSSHRTHSLRRHTPDLQPTTTSRQYTTLM